MGLPHSNIDPRRTHTACSFHTPGQQGAARTAAQRGCTVASHWLVSLSISESFAKGSEVWSGVDLVNPPKSTLGLPRPSELRDDPSASFQTLKYVSPGAWPQDTQTMRRENPPEEPASKAPKLTSESELRIPCSGCSRDRCQSSPRSPRDIYTRPGVAALRTANPPGTRATSNRFNRWERIASWQSTAPTCTNRTGRSIDFDLVVVLRVQFRRRRRRPC
jgi:hypothetical protein